MPWANTPDDRARNARVYGAEYKRNRLLARRRAGGRCEGCHHPHTRLECDHIHNTGHGPPDHSLGNLQMLCKGPGTCQCHERKTAGEGNAGRGASDPPCTPRTNWGA